MKKTIVLCGYGNVGFEFVKLLFEKKPYIHQKYGIELELICVAAKKAAINGCINLKTLIECGRGSSGIISYASEEGAKLMSGPVFSGDILVDATPTDITTGQPGSDNAMKALNAGMDIVFLSKGALITGYKKLMDLAGVKKVKIKYSGAAAAALPTIDLGCYSLAGCRIKSIEGVLNGTTNYILTRMYEDRISFKDALHEAIEKGIAEGSGDFDVKGIDSACKILILANSFMESNLALSDISIQGIDNITTEDMEKASSSGGIIKLLAKAYEYSGAIRAEVRPVEVFRDNFFYNINGTNKGVVFDTDTMGMVAVMGGASNPRAAAAAALKDIINLYR